MARKRTEVNQHRGRGPNELEARYRRFKDLPLPGEEIDTVRKTAHNLTRDSFPLFFDPDANWNLKLDRFYEYVYPDWFGERYEMEGEPLLLYRCRNILRMQGHRPVADALNLLDDAVARGDEARAAAISCEAPVSRRPEGEQEFIRKANELLHGDNGNIRGILDNDYALLDWLTCQGVDIEELPALFEYGDGTIAQVLLFSRFWIRSPGSFKSAEEDPLARACALVAHLFFQYPAPRLLCEEWVQARGLPNTKYCVWSLVLGRGHKLHHVAPALGFQGMTRALASALQGISGQFGPPQRLLDCAELFPYAPVWRCEQKLHFMWAVMHAFGGRERDFFRMAQTRAFLIDPFPDPTGWDFLFQPPGFQEDYYVWPAFWSETAKWLIRYGDDLNDEEAQIVLDWGAHEFIVSSEALRVDDSPVFTWRKRRPEPSLARARAYRDRVNAAQNFVDRKLPESWEGQGLNHTLETEDGAVWEIVELTTVQALIAEGIEMQHCVASYHVSCILGPYAIFSVRWNGQRRLTVRVDRRTMAIVEARGCQNRNAAPEERTILRRWKEACVRGS